MLADTRPRRKMSRPIALSFGGSGLMMLWQFGVASELAKSPKFLAHLQRVHGTSGGAIAGAIMLACPELFDKAVEYYCSGRWLRGMAPHNLCRHAITDVGIEPRASALRNKFVPHATRLAPFRNVSLDFDTDDDLVDAIAASCCLDPKGVTIRGVTYFDGGFSDPLPVDRDLPTYAVSILQGPSLLSPGNQPETPATSPRRYDLSLANAAAILETALLPPRRARRRYQQGQADARNFLARWHTAADVVE